MMPNRFFFFCGGSNSQIIISEPFEKETVSMKEVSKQCEMVFGANASKLSTENGWDQFTIFHIIGFHTIYGITSKGTLERHEGLLNVVYLKELNEFLMRETIEEKKAVYIAHAKLFISRFLETHPSEKIREAQETFRPITEFVGQQFHLASHALLHDGFKQGVKGKKREQHIQHLKTIGEYVTQELFIAMGIVQLISKGKEITQTILIDLLIGAEKMIIPDTYNAKSLAGMTTLTKDEAIQRTLSNLLELNQNQMGLVV